MNKTNASLGLGWLPDFPDYRDYTIKSEEVPTRSKALGETRSMNEMFTNIKLVTPPAGAVKKTGDLRASFSPVENQGQLGSCTANAGVGLIEYFERRSSGQYIDASRLFLYKVTRKLLGLTGDSGAQIRSTMGAMVLFGVPPEKFWAYTDRKEPGPAGEPTFDEEPPAFLYAYAQQYRALRYFRLDPPGATADEILSQIKIMISGGYPAMFGFTVYSSISQAAKNGGKIPFPTSGESVMGGHAIIVCGYDNDMKIGNTNVGGEEFSGALMIRNSWGTDWGDAGYGWLPYEYVNRGLARDWWSMTKAEWIDSGQFGF